MTLLLLKAGPLAVHLAPDAGGSIASFSIDGTDILRPMGLADRESGKGDNAAAYPLVPYSNRIANGELVFEGETFLLARNWPGIAHPMHGDGWRNAWQVMQADDRSAEIVYLHERAGAEGGWPFRYRAWQRYRLETDRLTVTLGLDNLEPRAVPAGIGLHPFFVRDADSELQCNTQAVWRTDAEVLPVERIAVPAAWDFSAGRTVDALDLDNCFDGWDGHAAITWPSRKLRLDLEASDALRHLVIYIPPEHRYFCTEPVSHASGQVGLKALGPGATREGRIVFRLSSL